MMVVDKMAMATFTVLFAIRIVAKSLLGLDKISRTRRFALVFSFRILSSCEGDKEKKATSLAENTADKINNPHIIRICIQTPVVMELNATKSMGKGSLKSNLISY